MDSDIGKILTLLGELKSTLEVHIAEEKDRSRRVDFLELTVMGNGNPSHSEQIRGNTREIERVRLEFENLKSDIREVIWEIISIPLRWLGVGLFIVAIVAAVWIKG